MNFIQVSQSGGGLNQQRNTVPLFPFLLLPHNRSSLIKMNQLQSTSAATFPPPPLPPPPPLRRVSQARPPANHGGPQSKCRRRPGGPRLPPSLLSSPLPTSERSMRRPNAVRSPPPLSRAPRQTRTVTGRGRSTVETPDAVRRSLTHSLALARSCE